jgi:hypothetical protein
MSESLPARSDESSGTPVQKPHASGRSHSPSLYILRCRPCDEILHISPVADPRGTIISTVQPRLHSDSSPADNLPTVPVVSQEELEPCSEANYMVCTTL